MNTKGVLSFVECCALLCSTASPSMSAVARRVVRVSIPMPLSPHAAPFVKGSGDQKDGGGDGHSNKKRRVAVVERKLFCDLDGVLCDFDRGCVKVMGTTPDQLSKKSMWTGLAKARSFCEYVWCGKGLLFLGWCFFT